MGLSSITGVSTRSLAGIYYYNPEEAELISETGTWQSNATLESQPKPYEVVLGDTEYEFSEFFRKIRFIESNIEFLQEFYIFNNPIEVKTFLFDHDHLYDILYEANKHIKRIFEDCVVNIYLQVVKDPEENFEQLFVIIKTDLTPDKSVSLLDRFDEEWWLEIDYKMRQGLEIDVETY